MSNLLNLNILQPAKSQLGSLHSTLKMETVCYAETIAVSHAATNRDNPEYWADTDLYHSFGPRLPLSAASSKDSVVGIATRYVLGGPGIESRCGREFPHPSRPAMRPTQSPIKLVSGLSRG